MVGVKESVLLNVEARVATITLNRPEVFNAFNLPVAEDLARAVQVCADDAGVRAVILTGSGRGFCAGGDMKAAWEHIQFGGHPGHFFRDLTVPFHRVITDMRLMPKPIIAAINGAAGGAGLSLAAACDLRLAAESAKFKQAYTAIGLVPDGGWTALVPQLIGVAKAMELLLLDPVLNAHQALAAGLVHEVVPDGALPGRARELAGRLADGPVTAFGTAKALVNASVLPLLEVQLERERQAIMAQGATGDFLEGLRAFVDKRVPRFNNGPDAR